MNRHTRAALAPLVCVLIAACMSNPHGGPSSGASTVELKPGGSFAQYSAVEIVDDGTPLAREVVAATLTHMQEQLVKAGLAVKPGTPPNQILVVKAFVWSGFWWTEASGRVYQGGPECAIYGKLLDKYSGEEKGRIDSPLESGDGFFSSTRAECAVAADSVVAALEQRISHAQ